MHAAVIFTGGEHDSGIFGVGFHILVWRVGAQPRELFGVLA